MFSLDSILTSIISWVTELFGDDLFSWIGELFSGLCG